MRRFIILFLGAGIVTVCLGVSLALSRSQWHLRAHEREMSSTLPLVHSTW